MNRLKAATLIVSNLETSCGIYTRHLGYRLREQGHVGETLAASWGAPASVGRPYAILGPASGADVFLRFVEGEPVAGYVPLKTYGWAAVELCIQDVTRVNDLMMASPFKIIGPPKLIDGLPTIHPMQVEGPDREIVYLTEIKDLSQNSGLPKPQSLVDHLFILVLACSDMNASGEWFRDRLQFDLSPPMSLVYTMLNDAFALPDTTLHRLATGSFQGTISLEYDEYPSEASLRPRRSGELAPGIALATITYPSLDEVDLTWIHPPEARDGVLYQGRRAGCVLGPDGVLVEVLEA